MHVKSSTKRLSTTLFVSIFVYSLLIILCFIGAFSALFYCFQEADAENKLEATAKTVAASINESTPQHTLAMLELQFDEGIRYTLIADDGAVIFDSEGPVLENHANRPEVVNAKKDGSCATIRYSETLRQDTIYAAVALENGSVIRLAQQRLSYFALIGSIAFPLIAAVVLIAILALVLSRLLTKRIVSPLDQVDVSNPLSNFAYEEMNPLLIRINEQKQQLLEQNNELARAENLRREFSANVSHEMKTPLQVISGYSELIQSGVLDKEEVKHTANIIHNEATRMNSLIDDVLTLSRLDDPVVENGGKEKLELLMVAKQAADRLLPLAQNYNVALRVLGSTVHIWGSKQLLLQLFTNLISNAIRYSNPGQEVTVLVGKTLISEEDIEVPEAFVRVKDNGCGIAKEEQEKIFERFYRVDKSRSKESGGTGLGLAIAKHAAEFHDATITVESQLGKGSSFTVHFPL